MPSYTRNHDKLVWTFNDQVEALQRYVFVTCKTRVVDGCAHHDANIRLLGDLTKEALALKLFQRASSFFAKLADFDEQQRRYGWAGAWMPGSQHLPNVRKANALLTLQRGRAWATRRRHGKMSPDQIERERALARLHKRLRSAEAAHLMLQEQEAEIVAQIAALPAELEQVRASKHKFKVRRAELLIDIHTLTHGKIQ